jgi:hypothetical protein
VIITWEQLQKDGNHAVHTAGVCAHPDCDNETDRIYCTWHEYQCGGALADERKEP